MKYLENLNQYQKEAVLCTEGPVLILAGAGAGKTKVITNRIAHLIKQGTEPQRILAVTFTNKAAKEMQERVNKILSEDSDFKTPVSFETRPIIKTFHSLGVYIIKQNHQILGLGKNFTILDSSDSKKIITEALKNAGYDKNQYEPRKIQSIISKQKSNLVTIDEYEQSAHRKSYIGDVVVRVWKEYESKLKSESALDFDDLLLKSFLILKKNPEILKFYQNAWDFIHVDEYQDTNQIQYQLIKLIAGDKKNVCVVGDIDQNIYSWRGADIQNIINFEKDYPNTKEIVLEQNYRSTQNILQIANEIIVKNKNRKEKNLFTKNNDGEKAVLYQAIDEYDEARFLAREARKIIDAGTDPEQIAFLYRANFQSRVLEEVCLEQNLPHQVIGTKFFDRKEIKDIFAYIKSAINEKDFTSMTRIINTPKRGIGKVTILKIAEGKINEINKGTELKLASFKKVLEEIRNQIGTRKPAEIIEYIFKKTGLEDSFKEQGEEGLERIENVKELIALSKKYDHYDPKEGMDKMLEDTSLLSDQDEMSDEQKGVKLMTIHAAKGLEFDYVFITGLESGLFPHQGFDSSEKRDDEEERRLFYVAITRAKIKLYLSHASFRTIYGSKEVNAPSEFIDDLNPELIENQCGFYNNDNSDDDNTGGARPSKEYLIDF